MMKLEYLIPEMYVVEFEVEDIVTSSPPNGGLNNGGIIGTEGGNSEGNIDADKLFPR